MKKIYLILLSMFAFCYLNSFAQEPVEINGYTIIEINGKYYDISGYDTLRIIDDIITLKYNSDITEQQITTIEQNYGLEKTFHAPTGWINYKLDSNSDVIDIMQKLATNEVIHEVLLNYFIPLFANPNEQAWVARDTSQTLLNQLCSTEAPIYNTSHLLMQVDSAWNITTGSPNIVIGFIDSGTAINHPDIGVGDDGYHNLWENPGEVLDGNDNDENGYIDDLFGWDFVNESGNLIIIDTNIITTSNHGTMVASNACSKTNNQLGTFGVAGGWGSKGSGIMTLKIGNDPFINSYTLTPALIYAIKNGARVVNMSFGNYSLIYPPFAEAIELASQKYNCLIFGAAGNNNSNSISWPARHNDVIATGASAFYCDGDVFMEGRWVSSDTYGSSFGAELDIVAPSYAYYCDTQSGYSWRESTTATSGATAFASGVAALILSANPCLLNYEVKEILASTADKIDTLNGNYDANGHSIYYGYGRINAYQAVLAAEQKMGFPDTTITTSTTWNTRIRYSGNITVDPEAILTITSMLYMDAGTKITVEPGGKLVVDGGTITTECLDPWLGIEVLGDPDLNQFPTSNQGWVQVINGGTIANAETAIRAGIKTFSEERFNYTQTGGIVQVENAIFSNNQTAIEMLPYNNTNISYIRHSTFETKATVLNTVVPDYFIKLIANNIQDISGCTFKNYRNVLEPNSLARGNGIYVFNSNLKNKCSSLITPCPPTEYYPNNFTNLYYGIYVLSAGHNSYISVIKNEFENNYRSLYLSGVTNARVTSNDFIINTPFEENGGYGMYLDGCTGYWVEDNEFRHNGTSATGIGLIVNNSGTNPNEVYRNRFIRLEQGISAQGTNKDYNTNIGLQLLCNDFTDTWADILIPKSESDRRFGIAAWQGDSTFMAGNLFHHHTGVPYNDINNEGEHITYFYPFQNTNRRLVPKEFTENTVTIVPVHHVIPWDYAIGCPCQLESGGGGQEEEMMDQMSESRQQAEATEEILGLLIDAGDTEALHWDVLMSTSPQAMQVYGELIGASPWLSDTVLSAAILKEDVLLDAMIRDIMVANPNTAKSDKLLEELEQRWTPLPEYMKAQILQGKNLVSAREHAEALLARHRLNQTRAVNALARAWQQNTDSLIWLWNTDNNLISKYNLAFMYLEMGQSAQGTAVLNNIPSQISLSNSQQSEYQQIQILYDILASLAQEGKGIQNAESQHISMLLDIESESTGPAAVYARNALLALQALTYNEPILLPDLLKSRAMETTYQTMLENLPTKSLNVFPLPARDFLIVEYVMDAEAKGRLEFTDDTGRLVHTMEVSGPVNQQIINTRDWKSGWYVASLKIQTKTMESVKFIITD